MPYSETVSSFSDEFEILTRKEALRLHTRWTSTFKEEGVDCKLLYQILRSKSDTEFYAMFDYDHSHIPVSYACKKLSGFADFDQPLYIDVIIVNKDFTWSVVFHHSFEPVLCTSEGMS